GIERLAEFHDVQTALAKGRPDRGRRSRSAGRHLQLDVADNLLCHLLSPDCARIRASRTLWCEARPALAKRRLLPQFLRITLSENRYPLFGVMREGQTFST